MTSILSSISGYFSKSLILGTVLPVVIFLVLSALFLTPLVPSDLRFLAPVAGIDKEWKVIAASFVAIVVSGLLYNLNIPILRLYEGYPWRNSWIGTRLTRRHVARFDAAQNRIHAMRACRRLMEKTKKDFASEQQWVTEFFANWAALGEPQLGRISNDHPWLRVWEQVEEENRQANIREKWDKILEILIDEYSALRRELDTNYPGRRGLILPTRLGNVIRSFEFYSSREYSIDSIVLWPRLVAIIPREFAVAVDDAKTTFDFMMNCSALSVLMSVLMLVAGLIYPTRLGSLALLLNWSAAITAFAFLSYFFYQLSINRVGAWGAMVKSAFDLYRWELLKKLGYEQQPKTREEERKVWLEISRQIIYGDRFDGTFLRYADAPAYPAAQSTTANSDFEITKGAETSLLSDVITFNLRVRNTAPNLNVANVEVTDKLPDDFDYEWDSARIGTVVVPVSGCNPYKFTIGNLAAAEAAVVSYRAIPRKEGRRKLDVTLG